MGLPSISIEFKSAGISAIQRGERGIVALILDEPNVKGLYRIVTIDDIPEGIREDNVRYIKDAMVGYVNPAREVKAYFADISGGEMTLVEALKELELVKFDYLAMPEADDEFRTDSSDIALQIKTWRDNMNKKVKAVLFNTSSDYEGVINLTTEWFLVNGEQIEGKNILHELQVYWLAHRYRYQQLSPHCQRLRMFLHIPGLSLMRRLTEGSLSVSMMGKK